MKFITKFDKPVLLEHHDNIVCIPIKTNTLQKELFITVEDDEIKITSDLPVNVKLETSNSLNIKIKENI